MENDKPIFPLPKEGELVAFTHGAAGHQGISSTAAGDLIIKPCTQAEIDFYEAAKAHPAFQAHMPTYIGKLELDNKIALAALTSKVDQGVQPSTQQTKDESSGENDQALAQGQSVATETEDTKKIDMDNTDNGEKSKAKGESITGNIEDVKGPNAEDELSKGKSGSTKETKAWVPSGGKKLNTGLAIVLENAAATFKKPNVMDIKLGSRLWADDAPEAKRKKLDQVSAETTSGSLGFRIAGAKLWLGPLEAFAEWEPHTEIKDGYRQYDKFYGRGLNEKSAEAAIARFISGTAPPTIKGRTKSWLGDEATNQLVQRLIREIESIEYTLTHEESRMYSASILIVIEGDAEALEEVMAAENEVEKKASEAVKDASDEDDDDDENEDDDDEESVVGPPKVMEVRLIDFAHAQFTPGQGPDENALKGVRSILTILRNISK